VIARSSAARPHFIKGTVIELDPAGPLYTAIGAGNLRAYADTDAVGTWRWRTNRAGFHPVSARSVTTKR
jgi:hypothetical protein